MAFKTKVLRTSWNGIDEAQWTCPLCFHTDGPTSDIDYVLTGVGYHLKNAHAVVREIKIKMKVV